MKVKEGIERKGDKKSSLFKITMKGSVIALAISLLLVLVFAFLLKFTNLPDSVISPINQVIKGISVFIGVFIGLKKTKELGLVSGLFIGILYTLSAFCVFSLLAGSFCFDVTLLIDLVFGGIIGSVCGIICVNLKKSNN
ncbi:MAG: TIGR04086 family membrane protein [Clostridiales bacterium]|nr:TIGR04086 family membrane protein [Clostridiales bacterium]